MRKLIAARTAVVAVGAIVLVVAASGPAMAGKGPKKDPDNKGVGQHGTPAKPPKPPKAPQASGPKASSPSKGRGNNGKGRSQRPKSSKEQHQNEGKGKAKGHDKKGGPAGSRRAQPRPASARPEARRVLSGRTAVGTEVLGLRISSGSSVVAATALAAPSLLPGAPGEALPLTGGDIAAMLFLGFMVITIGGLIWRAPSLIDKPRRSHDLSV